MGTYACPTNPSKLRPYCSAPLKSNHLGYLLRPILNWASIAQGLMRALFVVPPHPVSNDTSRVRERPKHVLPDAFFLETAEEPFNDPSLFRRIRRDELLLQPIISTGLPKPPTLEDQSIVTPQDRRPHGPQYPEPGQAGGFHRALGLLRPTPQRELLPNDFPIMTINHCQHMGSTILAARNMCHIHGPPFIASTRPTDPALHTRTRGGDAVMHEPPLLFQHSIDRFAIDADPVLAAQQHPQEAIAKRRMLLDQLVEAFGPGRIGSPASPLRRSRPMQTGSAHTQHLTTSPFRETRHARSHASDVFRSKG